MKLNILIVEDDQPIIDQWNEKIELYNVEEDAIYDIVPTIVKNAVDAKKVLSNTNFDAAVIDIRLNDNGGKPSKDGNELYKLISDSTLAIAAIYTGEPGIEEQEEYQKDFEAVFAKGDGSIDKILKWLDDKASMVAAIQQLQNSFRTEMAKVFSRSIWPRWSHWLKDETNSSFTVAALKRHMATHLHASFLSDENIGAHPVEYFFIPPLIERLDTGDIIMDPDGKLEILVTPRCDMINPKGDIYTYQLVTLSDKSEEWKILDGKLKELVKAGAAQKKIDTAKSNIKKFSNHNGQNGSHFIQRFRLKIGKEEKIYGPFYAQFNQLRSIPRNEENTKLLTENRIASLSNEFVPSLVERLGAYFSRIGTPDYSHPE